MNMPANQQAQQQASQQTQREQEKATLKQVTKMLANISTDWKFDIAHNEILATDPADNQQGVIAKFSGPNHLDITFATLAPATIITLLDLHKRSIAKVKELQAQIAALRDVKNQPDKDYSTQISMLLNDPQFVDFLINRYSLDENPNTKKARTACDKALKNELGVSTKSDIKWRKSWTDHWLNIHREYLKSVFENPEENAA